MNIIHGGGKLNGLKYSNSLESIKLHASKHDMIEIDVIKLKDSYGIAHDGLELDIYNHPKSFELTKLEEFLQLRAHNFQTTIDFRGLNEIMKEFRNAIFVLDIKEYENYIDCLSHVKNSLDCIDNIIPQVFREEDLKACRDLGYKVCMLSLWKYFSDISDIKCDEFISKAQEYGVDILGIAIFYDDYVKNKNFNSHDLTLYFYGQQLSDSEIKKFNEMGHYFFI